MGYEYCLCSLFFEDDVDYVVLVRPPTMNPSLLCMGRDLIMRSPTGRGKNVTIALVIDRYYGLLDRLPKIRSISLVCYDCCAFGVAAAFIAAM